MLNEYNNIWKWYSNMYKNDISVCFEPHTGGTMHLLVNDCNTGLYFPQALSLRVVFVYICTLYVVCTLYICSMHSVCMCVYIV